MSAPITNLQAAQRDAIMNRPAVNGFPHLAETLRRAGVRTNTWWLPAMQSLYETDYGPVLDQGVPLIDGVAEVPAFDRTALVTALRADQAGQTSFREFAAAAWRAGVLRYVVDLENRTCTYFGLHDQTYMEHYAAVEPTKRPESPRIPTTGQNRMLVSGYRYIFRYVFRALSDRWRSHDGTRRQVPCCSCWHHQGYALRHRRHAELAAGMVSDHA